MHYVPALQRRILAIDPTPRGFGYAVLEGPRRLVDWGLKEVPPEYRNRRSLFHIRNLVRDYAPDLVVVEDIWARGSRRGPRVQRLIRDLLAMAASDRFRTRRVSRAMLKRAFTETGKPTKYRIAQAIAARFPELAWYLPPVRKPWMSEDARMGIFDAVALALAVYHHASHPDARSDHAVRRHEFSRRAPRLWDQAG